MNGVAFVGSRHKNYPVHLLAITLVLFAISAIGIQFPFDFFLEHILTVVLLAILIFTYKNFRLSNLSYTFIFAFMLLHILGAHYTYTLVPYDDWSKSLFGITITEIFGFTRNHYDRLVHFSFGLLLAYPVREFFIRIVAARGFWGYYLPLDVMASFSVLYELLEFGVSVLFGGEIAANYNGEQGDRWDAHKDMLLAILGGIITMMVTFCVNWRYKKNFTKDLKESFKVRRKTPLGEVELRRIKHTS
ncbi:MAG: DUF2238 domain-containing protein [Nanoarchaeota archaeon]